MPSQLDYKLTLQTFQSQRLRRDHADLAVEQQYRQIAEFFFEEMYGPHDFSSRDEQAHRLQQFVHLAPGLAARDIQDVLELLELTNQSGRRCRSPAERAGSPARFRRDHV